MSVREILEKNPKLTDELLYQLVKIAACKKKKLKKTAAGAVGKNTLMAVSSVAALYGLSKLDNFLDSKDRQKRYEAMLAQNKELKSNKNPMLVLQYFNALYEMAPEVAKNPATAAAFVKGQLDMEGLGMNISSLNTLTGITKNLSDRGHSLKGKMYEHAANIPAGVVKDIYGGD